jgi:hypothetical protein
MRILIFGCFLLLTFLSQAQDLPEKKAPRMKRHVIGLSPASIWSNKGFFIGHGFDYRLKVSRSTSLILETDGTLFRELDQRSKLPSSEKVLPLLNQSGFSLSRFVYGHGKSNGRQKQTRWRGSIRLGYHFFQHSTRSYDDYWTIDSTLAIGRTNLAAFRSHSISGGLEFSTEKRLRREGTLKRVSEHYWLADYIGSVHYQVLAHDLNESNTTNLRVIDNAFDLKKSGVRFKYRYIRWFNPSFGIHAGFEAVLVPFIDYSPNYEYFVPRGGEVIHPYFFNLKVGVSFNL